MMIQHRLRVQRLSQIPTNIVLCLMLPLVLSGCAALQVYTFNKHAADGDREWIAAQTVTCKTTTHACSRLHLIKGDACFQLAKTGTTPVDNYTCAADELEQGLALKQPWPDAAAHRQFQENLCESLRSLQDLRAGKASAQNVARLVDAAQGLYRLTPESVPAVYYLAKARLYQTQPMLVDINPASRVPVCNRLKRTVTRVLSMMESAKAAPLPDWERFADKYQRLAFELGSAMHATECR